MRANRPALKFPSWVSDSRFHKNFSSHLSSSWNSISPRLALFNSPSNRYARGSDSEPYSVIVEKSMLPVRSAMSWDFGSDGLKVPMPIRRSSDRNTRSTGTSSMRPSYSMSTRSRQAGHRVPSIFTPSSRSNSGRNSWGTR